MATGGTAAVRGAAPAARGAVPTVRVAAAGEATGGARKGSMLRGMSARRTAVQQALNAAKRPAAAGMLAHIDLLSLLFGDDGKLLHFVSLR